jgi:diguanylate cyclase (GGDEF)-like protein/PAS domain S-box-containing protein
MKNRLRLLAEHSTDVILLTGEDSQRLYVSPAVREVLGWTEAEFLQQSYLDSVHPDDAERVTALLGDTGEWQRLSMVYRCRRADGQELWVESQISKFAEDGQKGRVITLRDITRRRLAELALEKANQELASLVWKDGLTGLANRRRFDEALISEWEQARINNQPLSILLIDVDHFKLFNDQYGHQRGDHCLVTVADSIAGGTIRASDLAARYGGEEFAVILPNTLLDDAARTAERIRQNLTLLLVEHRGSPYGVLTLSVGVAGAVPRDGGSVHDIVKAADEALYTSKREGRNRTTVLEVGWS